MNMPENIDIRKEILVKLLKSKDGIRYRDGKPNQVENDLYNYHLQQLLKKGLIRKDEGKYLLSQTGKKYIEVDSPINAKGKNIDLFRLNILAIVYKKVGTEFKIISHERKKHPYYGSKGLISGAVDHGESVVDASNKALLNKTGLQSDFKIIGTIRKIIYDDDNNIFSDILFFICLGQGVRGDFVKKTDFGTNHWVSIDEIILNEKNATHTSKSVVNVLKMLKESNFQNRELFYFEDKLVISKF